MSIITIKVVALGGLFIAATAQFMFAAAFLLSSLPVAGSTKSNNHHISCTSEATADNDDDENDTTANTNNNDGISTNRIRVYGEENIDQLYETALDIFLKVVHDNPRAVILLPTGSTPKPFYKKLIAAFDNKEEEGEENSKKLDLSEVTFFNLDEYVGLPSDHPLSYHWFMEKNLYGPLRSIDLMRAPKKENIHIPATTTAGGGDGDGDGDDDDDDDDESIQKYGKLLQEAISTNGGRLDLAILGVGGAYPVRTEEDGSVHISGGHLAFNEPGSDVSQSAHFVQLTEKTRKDTAYRFKSLANLIRLGELDPSLSTDVPTHAMTLGLADIIQADTILVLATGDEKAPVLQKAFASPNNIDVPVSHLVENPNVLWLLDESAARTLPEHAQIINDFAIIPPGQLSDLVNEAVVTAEQFFPQGENVLILSPHPDDDVISMGASIVYLRQRGCKVFVAYAVTGANAVRPEGDLFEEGLQWVMESPAGAELASTEDLYPTIETRAKAYVRRREAIHATSLLGIPPENLEFLECDYYNRRGVEGVEAITDNDLRKMMNVITSSSPKHMFFAAESDPHGAHGLAAELLAKALENIPDLDATLWGYRGAYAEWPLRDAERLSIIPFEAALMDLKVRSIKQHVSQLNPMYPSFDAREFYERAIDRNRAFAKQVSKVIGRPLWTMDSDGKQKAQYAEAFRRYTKGEFIQNNRKDL